MQDKFILYYEENNYLDLPFNENYLVYRWTEPDCKILFSVAQCADAAACHFASDKRGLRRLRIAINDFVDFIFNVFPWCKKVLARVIKPSVARLIIQCGFNFVTKTNDYDLYIRRWNHGLCN